jgi:hypothetical protein
MTALRPGQDGIVRPVDENLGLSDDQLNMPGTGAGHRRLR